MDFFHNGQTFPKRQKMETKTKVLSDTKSFLQALWSALIRSICRLQAEGIL